MKTVCLLSGGVDSTTLLYQLKAEGDEILALSFNYGQRHKKELKFAKKTCEKLGIWHEIADISKIRNLLAGSALTDDIEVPEGHYTDEKMKITVVPNRNAIFLSIAIGYAISQKADRVAYAAHLGDFSTYPDCRPEFLQKVREMVRAANYESVGIYAPFLFLTKAEILKQGKKLGVNYHNTWSCYKGEKNPCLKCGTCIERIKAFSILNKSKKGDKK